MKRIPRGPVLANAAVTAAFSGTDGGLIVGVLLACVSAVCGVIWLVCGWAIEHRRTGQYLLARRENCALYRSFAFTFPDDIHLKSLNEIQVSNGFILTLPFRVRTGTFFVLQIGDSFDVVFRNRLDIPSGTPSDDLHKLIWEGKKFRPREQFYTEALILDKKPPVPPDFRDAFLRFMDSPSDEAMPDIEGRPLEALTCLNDAIVGYHHATNSSLGGSPVKRLGLQDFLQRITYLHTIVTAPSHQLSKQDLLKILDARDRRAIIQVPGIFTMDQLDDVADSERAEIQRYTQLHQRFLFYQFALDAKSRMFADDCVSAVLFAVVALEGVHSALLQIRLDRTLAEAIPDADERAKRAERIAKRLLTELGFSQSLDMTLDFLDASDRPPAVEVEKCKAGIRIRNEIMHASAKNGQYCLRNRTNKELSDAYSSVLKVFSHFVTLVERNAEGGNRVNRSGESGGV